MVVRRYFQRMHPRGAGVLLQRDVQEYENEIQLRKYRRQRIQHHH